VQGKADYFKDRFQQVGTFEDGNNLKFPILIDDQSKKMLQAQDPIIIDVFGWSFFRKLGIRDRPVKYLSGGSC
jgi:hypothetical protein